MTDDNNDSMKPADIRNKLLRNGFVPLPLRDKGIFIKGWSREKIDAKWLKRFARSRSMPNTGLRCDDLLAFDIDILDEDVADAIDDLICEETGGTDYCRIGRYPKRLLLFRRTGTAIPSSRTPRYEGEDGEIHMVELLAGSGRQFAAYGTHPGTGKPYYWDSEEPLHHKISSLPALDSGQAQRIMDAITKHLDAHGWPRVSRGMSLGNGRSVRHLYDLSPDTEFLDPNGAIVTWSELKPTLDEQGVMLNMRREDGEFGDSGGIHCYLAEGSREACCHDFPRDVTHFEQVMPNGLTEALERAAEVVIAEGKDADDLDLLDSTPDCLRYLLKTYVLLADKTVRYIEAPAHAFTFEGFRLKNSHLTIDAPTKAQPDRTVLAVDEWKAHPQTARADRAELRPDHPDDAFIQEGLQIVFNTYCRPMWHDWKGSLWSLEDRDVFERFMTHLLPRDAERELFLDWLAVKLREPWQRLHAVVMVTPVFGVGRGTLGKLLKRLFGGEYVREVPLNDLTGGHGQATFNEYLAGSLILTVPEALELEQDRSRYYARASAYEHLKDLCDPGDKEVLVKRKFGRNSHEKVFSSVLISTNHEDALAIPHGDRRLLVLENGRVPLADAEGNLMLRVHHAWQQDSFVAGLYQWLMAREVRYQPNGEPMMTPAKEAMIESSRNDVDVLFDEWVQDAKGELCTLAQWRAFVFRRVNRGGYDIPDGDLLDRVLKAVLSKRGRRVPALGGKQIKAGGAPVRPWVLRNWEKWEKDDVQVSDIKEELRLNGDTTGKVLPFGK